MTSENNIDSRSSSTDIYQIAFEHFYLWVSVALNIPKNVAYLLIKREENISISKWINKNNNNKWKKLQKYKHIVRCMYFDKWKNYELTEIVSDEENILTEIM